MTPKKCANFSLTPLAHFFSLGSHTVKYIIQMKTKAILLAAAAVAMVASSQAQVYSVNAVGYVNTTLKGGFNLVSNPLNAADNTIGNLFKNIQGGVPGGTTVYKFVNGNFVAAVYDDLDNVYTPAAAAAETVVPGDGVFVLIPGTTDKVLTFVGEVPQGPTATAIPKGFSIKSSVVPQAVAPDKTKNTDGSAAPIPAADADVLYRYKPATKNYDTFSYIELLGGWDTPLPVIDVGEAFYYFRATTPTTWNRTFSVNNPQ
jgi:hypothetical protein